MKTLVKISAICALILVSFTANAQLKIGAGLNFGLPTGDFGDIAKLGIGGGISGKYMLNDNMSLGLGISYLSFTEKEDSKGKYNILPIAANFSYYFATEGFKPYAGLDLGMASFVYKYDGTKFGDSETKLCFAPVVGFEYGFSDNLALDVNAKYMIVNMKDDDTGAKNLTYIGINAGLVFSLGK
jgi:opacity protein-like surface antigen